MIEVILKMMHVEKQNRLQQTAVFRLPEVLVGILWLNGLHADPRKSEENKAKELSAADKAKSKQRIEAYYHFSLARLLEENGDFSKAIDEYKKAIQHDPQSS